MVVFGESRHMLCETYIGFEISFEHAPSTSSLKALTAK
jgi:hypothetical protein